jgi:protein-L-isoaspartate(D-aspartate) O-methyltransferase
MSGPDFTSMRRLMVSNQLRPSAVIDLAVLAAMEVVPRERFVPDDQIGVAYRDNLVKLGNGRALNPPLATALLLQAAAPRRGQRALVIGAATGYVPALLAAIGLDVTALEEDAALLARARLTLAAADGIDVVEGELAHGWSGGAPYDLVFIDGAVGHIPNAIVAQARDLGVVVAGLIDRGITRQVEGRRVHGGFNVASIADVEMAPLPGFVPAPAFAF